MLLERWEGGDIAFVYVPQSGSRYKATGAPEREEGVFWGLVLGVLGVLIPARIVYVAATPTCGALRARF